jgi:alpha-glucosidase (family GH31 glycosyl hydrolase)
MTKRKLPASWKPYNTYDYVTAEEWTVGDDIELYAVKWSGKPHSAKGFNNDWTLFINAKSRQTHNNVEEQDICIILQVTSYERNSFRLRFCPSATSVKVFHDKVYGPIEANRLEQIRQYEQAQGMHPELRWNKNGASILLRSISVDFLRTDNDLLSIQIKRFSDGAVTDISSGPLAHAKPGIGTVANTKRNAQNATHYFGLGEIVNYNLTGKSNPETGPDQKTSYGYSGRATLDHIGNQVTCYNYDNLWYNQPEVFPRSVAYKDAFKANAAVPLYLNAPFYIERAVINGCQQFLGVFLDNTGQSFFALKSPERDQSTVTAGVQHGEFDCHYMFAERSAGVLDAYTYLMGRGNLARDGGNDGILNSRAVMPPKYIFGYFQAKYGCLGLLRPTDDTDPSRVYINDIVKGHRDAEIPLEGLGVDIDVQEDKKVFTIKDSFWSGGKVGSGVSVFDWATDYNLQCQTNITPFIRADKVALDPSDSAKAQYKSAEGLIKNSFCVQNEGEANILKFRGPTNQESYPGLTYTRIGNVNYPDQNVLVLDYGVNAQTGERDMIGAVVTDYGNPDAARFWGDQYAYLFKNGLGFVWQDMTVPDPMPHVEDGINFADSASPRNQFAWSLTGEEPDDDRRRTNTFNWRSYHGQLRLTDPRFGDGRKTPFVELRNFHAYMLARSSYQYGLEAHENLLKTYKRSYIICRSGYPGLQHYSGHWIGDNASTWYHLQVSLPQILNLGLSGIPISGADVGGFAPGEDPEDPANTFYGEGNPKNRNHNPMVYDRLALGPEDIDIGAISSPELMTRWLQAASLQPWVRNHYDAMKQYQEIYHYTEKATTDGQQTFGSIMTEFVRFRVRWHHLLYDAMYQNTQTGAPINQAMCLWDEDVEVFSEKNRDILATQFFIDRTVLVAPILTKSTTGRTGSYSADTDVYFPRGAAGRNINWYRYRVITDAIDFEHPIPGGQRLKINATIDELPIFIKEGAIIPERHASPNLNTPFNNIQSLDKYNQPLVLSFYPLGKEEQGKYKLYWDDGGITRSAENNGNFSVIELLQKNIHKQAPGATLEISLSPSKYNYPLHDHIYLRLRLGAHTARKVLVDRRPLTRRASTLEEIFAQKGQGLYVDDSTNSLWIKISTAALSTNRPIKATVELT